MLNQFVVVGDLHCSPTSLPAIEKLFNVLNIIQNYTPIFLGDFFHSKNKFDSRFLIELFSILSSYKNEAIVISGNHDFIDNETSIIDILPSNFIKITKPTIKDFGTHKFAFLPYTVYTEEAASLLLKWANPYTILFSHIIIDTLTDLNLASFPKPLFNDFRAVINGHVHTSKIVDHILQPGSIYPVSISEVPNYNPFLIFIENGSITDVEKLNLFSIVETDEFNSSLNNKSTIIKTNNKELLIEYDNVFKIFLTTKKEHKEEIGSVVKLKQSFNETLKTQIESFGLNDIDLSILKVTLPKTYNLWEKELIIEDVVNILELTIKDAENLVEELKLS